MFCPKCGKEIPDQSTFCSHCGASVSTNNSSKGSGSSANNSQKPKKKTAPIVAIVAAVAVLAILAFVVVPNVFGQGNPQTSSKEKTEQKADNDKKADNKKADSKDEDSEASDKNSDGTTKKRYEDFTVSDVKVVTEGVKTPEITFTVTNNTDQIAQNVSVSAEATYSFLDNYGDEDTAETGLDVISTENGNSSLPYVFPGENEFTLVPSDRDNIVATHSSDYTKETQKYTLKDVSDVTVNVDGGSFIDANQYAVLSPDEYDVDLKMSAGSGYSPELTVTITNNTDYKWRSVSVYVVAIGKDGELAQVPNGSSNSDAFHCGPLSEQYFNPGESKEMRDGYSSTLDVDHFEVQRVIVQKEMGKSSDD